MWKFETVSVEPLAEFPCQILKQTERVSVDPVAVAGEDCSELGLGQHLDTSSPRSSYGPASGKTSAAQWFGVKGSGFRI